MKTFVYKILKSVLFVAEIHYTHKDITDWNFSIKGVSVSWSVKNGTVRGNCKKNVKIKVYETGLGKTNVIQINI